MDLKVFGFIPARMAASRFPGKPLHPICGRPMLEHCFERARLCEGLDELIIATCDDEIYHYSKSRNYPVIMTSMEHKRALDRVAEAVKIKGNTVSKADIVVCIQADEPLLGPDVINAVVQPFKVDETVTGTVLAVPIFEENEMLNPDSVKLVHDIKGDLLYTSRAPIPYYKPGTFSSELGAKRVGGIFGFRMDFLQWFTSLAESPLELAESCDSNRIYDNGRRQRMALAPIRPYYSVDSPEDVDRVESVMEQDPLWGKY